MKTQVHQKLRFSKNVITELNTTTMSKIVGGTSDTVIETATQAFEEFPISRFTSRLCNPSEG